MSECVFRTSTDLRSLSCLFRSGAARLGAVPVSNVTPRRAFRRMTFLFHSSITNIQSESLNEVKRNGVSGGLDSSIYKKNRGGWKWTVAASSLQMRWRKYIDVTIEKSNCNTMEILGVKFAPLNVPLRRRLETLSAAIWIVFLGFGDLIGYILTAYILFCTVTLRYLLLLYFVWMYYDWNTCTRGGRSERWTRWLRNCVWLRYFCNYFPIKLVKTADLDPNKSYLLCSFPHGILSTGIFGAFGTDVLGCKEKFPGLDMRVVVLDQHFRIPLFREYAYFSGTISSSAESLSYQLSTKPQAPFTGNATVLIVGGASESLECKPGTYRILVKRRKGFVKIALKHGAPLVPVFSFGETDIYDQLYRSEGTLLKRVQHFIRKKVGIAPIILRGRGFFQYSFGLIAQRKPVTVVVGSPMELPKIDHPTPEQIDEYHEKFIKHLIDLFESHKHKYIENADSVSLELM